MYNQNLHFEKLIKKTPNDINYTHKETQNEIKVLRSSLDRRISIVLIQNDSFNIFF